jgi:hypothetical protein
MPLGLVTDFFLKAFPPFTCRRGAPTEVVWDNGSNIVGALNELKKLTQQRKILGRKIKRKTGIQTVRRLFNSPAAPRLAEDMRYS